MWGVYIEESFLSLHSEFIFRHIELKAALIFRIIARGTHKLSNPLSVLVFLILSTIFNQRNEEVTILSYLGKTFTTTLKSAVVGSLAVMDSVVLVEGAVLCKALAALLAINKHSLRKAPNLMFVPQCTSWWKHKIHSFQISYRLGFSRIDGDELRKQEYSMILY